MFDVRSAATTPVLSLFVSERAPEPTLKVAPTGRDPEPPAAAGPDPAARRLAAELFSYMDGIGTNEAGIHRALRGRSAEELTALRSAYADHYPGHDLDRDLASELSGDDLEALHCTLTSDPVSAAALALERAANGMGTDEEAITETLRRISDPAEREAVAAACARRSGRSLDDMLQAELSADELAVIGRLTVGDSAGADAARLDQAMNGGFLGLGLGTDEDAIFVVLEQARTPAARQAVAEAYQRRTGRALDDDLASELATGQADLAGSLRRGDAASAAASRLAMATEGVGTDEDLIFRQLEGRPAAERQAIIAAYDRRYGAAAGGRDFADMVSDELGELDATRARQLAEDGRMDPVFALRYAMEGVGTDEGMIREVLRGRSREEIAALRVEYRATHGRDLDADLEAENSGRDGFEIVQAMLGEPRTPEERLARASAAYDFERGSGAGVLGRFVTDWTSDAGPMMDASQQRLAELGARVAAGTASAADLARIETVADYHRQDVQSYQAAHDALASGAAMGTTAVVGTGLSILTAGGATPGVVAAMAALSAAGGAGAGVVARLAIQGDSLSHEELASEAAMAIVAAATAGAIQTGAVQGLLEQAIRLSPEAAPTLLQTAARQAIQGGGVGFASGAAGGLLDERTWRGTENGFMNLARRAGLGALSGAAQGATAGVIQHRLDALRLGDDGDPGAWPGLSGGLAGAGTGVAQTLTDPGAYSGGADEFGSALARNVVVSAGQFYARGAHWAQRARAAADPEPRAAATLESARGGGASDRREILADLATHPGSGGLRVVPEGTMGPLRQGEMRPAEARQYVAMMEALASTPTGRAAHETLERLGVPIRMDGDGSWSLTRPGGELVNIDFRGGDAAKLSGTLAHEAHHAETWHRDVTSQLHGGTRQDYMRAAMRNEAEAQVQMLDHIQDLGVTSKQPGYAAYQASLAVAREVHRALHPDATVARIEAAARDFARRDTLAHLERTFASNHPSSSYAPDPSDPTRQVLIPGQPATYAEAYGQDYDRRSQHPAAVAARKAGTAADEAPLEAGAQRDDERL